MAVNPNTLRQRARDLLGNIWTSILLFRELPVGNADNLEDEIYLLEHNPTGGGVKYRPVRIPLSQLFSSIPSQVNYRDEGNSSTTYLPSEQFDEGNSASTPTAGQQFDEGGA
jgi:hypothetical protein